MVWIANGLGKRIIEYGASFVKADAMLPEVCRGLGRVPFKASEHEIRAAALISDLSKRSIIVVKLHCFTPEISSTTMGFSKARQVPGALVAHHVCPPNTGNNPRPTGRLAIRRLARTSVTWPSGNHALTRAVFIPGCGIGHGRQNKDQSAHLRPSPTPCFGHPREPTDGVGGESH